MNRAATNTDIHEQAETLFQALLCLEGLENRAVYRPGEVCRILRISSTTLRELCSLAEHPAVKNANPKALDSFLVGCHHRITRTALIDWLMKNQAWQRNAD